MMQRTPGLAALIDALASQTEPSDAVTAAALRESVGIAIQVARDVGRIADSLERMAGAAPLVPPGSLQIS